MDTKILELIKVVNDNYNHIQQLETLIILLKDSHPEECVVAKTTQNAHYNYCLLGHKKFQHAENHIDCFIDKEWNEKGHVVCKDKPLITAADDEEIPYPKKSLNDEEVSFTKKRIKF